MKSLLSTRDRERFSAAAVEAATAAGATLLDYLFKRVSGTSQLKAKNDLVTSADLNSSEVIKESLKRRFPDHSYLFEEEEYSEDNKSAFLWIIDPLDGTTFHHRGLPFFSVMIALKVAEQIEIGLAYNPYSQDLFISSLGGGAFHRNPLHRFEKRLEVSSVSALGSALIGYSHGKTDTHIAQIAEIAACLIPRCRAVTRLGGADIGYVAAGACEAFLDNNSTPWDFAPIALMIREAGGTVSDLNGDEWTMISRSILVANPMIHSEVLHLLMPLRS